MHQSERVRVKYIKSLKKIQEMPEEEREELEQVTERFPFRSNDYYLGLINWEDKSDPIRRIVIPCLEELAEGGTFDPSDERRNYVAKGVQHKYTPTALFLVSDMCGGFCRFCFRKRLFKHLEEETSLEISDGLEYIRQHEEIDNVLLTGGDPLILGTRRLDHILTQIRRIPHIRVIRIGTKMLSYNPYRVLNDPELVKVLSKHTLPEKRIYLITHFNHPRELTSEAIRTVNILSGVHVLFSNQTPIIRGVNDDPRILAELFNRLSYVGIPPYYLFQCRPTIGNRCYSVPIEEGYHIFEEAKKMMSGLSKRARYVMSHASGKVEVVGIDDELIHFRYHQARDEENIGAFFSLPRDSEARWLDDFESEELFRLEETLGLIED
ncbi:MAG: KamA family radical SAM protein [Thermoplasmata archaeon]